ncbi:iron complex outermembrane recepter protein, partial [Flaviramulus basaltis]
MMNFFREKKRHINMVRLLYTLFFLFFSIMSFAQQTALKGVVTEQSTSIPLPGVNVVIKGTTTGTSTDFDGNYQIEVKNGDIIVFTYVGYQAKEITYNGQST